jgi:arylsulfatase A-like enzyme
MIVSWPGVTRPGSVCRQPVIIEDFFPTILEMAKHTGAQQLGGEIDGLSFVNLLRGEHDESRETRPLVWHYPNNWGPRGPGIGPSSAIRVGDWKLIYCHETQRYELFNLAEDLGERTNLAGKNEEVRSRLAGQLARYLIAVDAQMPVDRKTGKKIPYPSE